MDWAVMTSMSPLSFFDLPPSWPMAGVSSWLLRKVESASRHWAASSTLGTMMAVGTWRCAISAQAMTVLPAPGGATRTPVRCLRIALTAVRCAG